MGKMRSKPDATSMDLFCGAGGLTLGLTAAGFQTVLGSDCWSPAVRTFESNFPEIPILHDDVRDLTGADLLAEASIDHPPALISGGPPCQGFSSAGARRDCDDRNSLVSEFARLVSDLRPSAFLFENVEGFLTTGSGRFVFHLLDPLIDAGYSIKVKKFNVANWGVPQLRKRVVAIGALRGEPPTLIPTHRARGAPGADKAGHILLPSTPSVADTLEGLPPPMSAPPGVPSDHYSQVLSAVDADRISHLGPGQTMRDLPERLWHASYRRRANRRVSDGMPSEKRGGAPAGVRRLRSDEPSKAITGAAQREFIHPTENRPLTLRECARLQTFPDAFEFLGNRSERQVLIGNAVPPLFAQQVAEQLRLAMTATSSTSESKGRLLSFDVSNGEGKSPALRAVSEAVVARYGTPEQLHLLEVQ